jgi:regulator of cell morphogenesis and NO signaling
MTLEPLAAALEHEHHEIDQGIEAFASALAAGESRPEPLTQAIDALRRHIYLEERFLFPALRKAGLVTPVLVMLREHGQIWGTLDRLELGLTSGTVGAATLKACRELTVQLQHHNLKEEKILYPQIDRVLTASARAELSAFLDLGKMPESWVCERARGPADRTA